MSRQQTAVLRLAVLLSAALLANCRASGPPAPDVVARIGDQQLPYAEFESYLRDNSLADEVALSSEVLSGLFDQYLDEAILARLAVERRELHSASTPREAIEAMVLESLPEDFQDSEVADYYARYRQEFDVEETVVLRQILVESREAAERALAAITAGGSFEEVASEHSQGPGAELGGIQGELSRADLPPAFADVIFSLESGEVSEIVAADYGFHIFQAVERRLAVEPSLSQARPVIVARLRSGARARVVAQLVDEARSSYNVVVYARNLPFNYAGQYK